MTQGIEQAVGATLVSVRNGPGARLRAAREAADYSIKEVAELLRLNNVSLIERMETDNYESNTLHVFIKGYLRSYAKLVGLDPDQIILEFSHLGLDDPLRDPPDLGHTPQRKLSSFEYSGTPKHRPGLLWGSLGVFVCAMLAFMWGYRDQLPGLTSPEASTTTISVLPAASSQEEASLDMATHSGNPATPVVDNAVQPAPSTTSSITSAPAAQAPAPVATTPARAPVAATPTQRPVAPMPFQRLDQQNSDNRSQSAPPPKTSLAPKPKKAAPSGTHETMLF